MDEKVKELLDAAQAVVFSGDLVEQNSSIGVVVSGPGSNQYKSALNVLGAALERLRIATELLSA